MKIEDLKIIRLKPDDWLECKNISLEMLKLEPGAFYPTYEKVYKYPNKHWRDKLRDKNEIYLFAKSDNKIIGSINANLEEANEKKDVAVIHGTYVNNFYRGKGVGKRLVKELLREIKKNKKIKRIKLWIKETQIPARHIYELMGLSFTKRVGEHTLIMEKQLK